jgi:[acyl-carrier-protein] S-malonyltransferase
MYKIVNWRGAVEKIIDNQTDLFIEIGPKKVLGKMMKDIDSSIPVLNVENEESLENTMKALTE